MQQGTAIKSSYMRLTRFSHQSSTKVPLKKDRGYMRL